MEENEYLKWQLNLPRPAKAVAQAQRKTRMRVRQKRPSFIDREFIASTYITSLQNSGRNSTMRTNANTSTAINTYPAVPRLAELAA